MTTITLTTETRAHCAAEPRTAAEAALLALDGTAHADDADARCAIEAALGCECDTRRTTAGTLVFAAHPIAEATGRAVAQLD